MKWVVVVLFLFLALGLVSAGFQTGNLPHSLQKEYGLSQPIKGWINISFSNQPISSIFKDSGGKSISLKSLLNKSSNSGYVYNCSTQDCSPDYSNSNDQNTKTFTANSGETKIFGFRFVGNIFSIKDIKFEINSTAVSSCSNPTKAEIFGSNGIILTNNKYSNDSCSSTKTYGCFDASKPTDEFDILTTPYCERVNLTNAPGLRLGAWLREETLGVKKINVSLYDEDLKVASCELPKSGANGEVFCDVSYSISNPKEYYVCISGNTGSGTYKTKGNSAPTTKCGFYGFPVKTETASYQIFAESKKYADFGNMLINNTFSQEKTLGQAAEDYINDKYGSLDCSQGCVVPIKFMSYQNQQITLKNLYLSYEKDSGVVSGNANFYDIEETPAKINSYFQKLYLDESGFLSDSSLGNFTFKLYLNDEQLFSEKLIAGKVPVINSLTPLIVPAGFPTEFRVNVNSSSNITKYRWNFGDGTTKETATNKVSYSYSEEGTYSVAIDVTDSNQKTSARNFSIIVGNPSNEINKTINKKISDINDIKSQIGALDQATKDRLNTLFSIDESETELNAIRTDFENGESYSSIIDRLNNIKVPESLSIGVEFQGLSFLPDDKIIDPYLVDQALPGSYNENLYEDYINAIVAWNLENISSKMDMAEFLIKIDDEEKTLRVFELNIKNSGDGNGYLFVKDMENLNFGENYGQKQGDGFTYVPLSADQKIIFSTTENVDFTQLPAFISPTLESLNVKEHNIGPRLDKFNLSLYALILGILIVGWMIIYTVLYNWYKYKYETHLFSNRNNLLNLVTYINNEKRKGIQDSEIEKSLKKTKWTSEQISYAFRKYAGKRTGMLELPFFKIFRKKSKENVTLKEYRGFRNDYFNQMKFMF
ncbi:MAG: PKD domain-containing protein [Nanoarchaeota archaeon]